jgi:hypothetical protein
MSIAILNVTKKNLTIKSASGNPDDTWVKANNSKADVFHVQADKTNIYGLKNKWGTIHTFRNKSVLVPLIFRMPQLI